MLSIESVDTHAAVVRLHRPDASHALNIRMGGDLAFNEKRPSKFQEEVILHFFPSPLVGEGGAHRQMRAG